VAQCLNQRKQLRHQIECEIKWSWYKIWQQPGIRLEERSANRVSCYLDFGSIRAHIKHKTLSAEPFALHYSVIKLKKNNPQTKILGNMSP
jgi:hypothetical protein